ncbi:MAG: D-alanine--D-alanine ligase [Verrucomicrobiota bacterium]|jgi:D-alanine-D-alanine ligase
MLNRALNICVMLGGPSAERQVSLRSGAAAAKALRALGHRVRELDPAGDSWQLPPETEVVFLALHGTYGEDGGVQARLEELGAPYTGCGPEASRTAFNKALTKQRCLSRGIPTARFDVLRAPRPDLPPGWTPPVVLKPVRQGSSIGLQFVERAEQWEAALAEAFRYDTEVLLEEKIDGRETTVGILEDRALPVAEIRVKNGPFDYRNKYTAGAAQHFCPADFDAATTARIQSAALGAFHAIGGRDFARVDVMVTGGGDPVVLEVNTLPGLTELSIMPEAAAAAGLNYGQLCQRMIDLALRRSARK